METKRIKNKGYYEIIVNKNDHFNICDINTRFTEEGNNIPWFFSMWVKT